MFKYLKRKLDKSEADKFLRFTQVYADMKILEEKLSKQFSTPSDGLKAEGKEKLPLRNDKPQKKKSVTPSLLKEISSPLRVLLPLKKLHLSRRRRKLPRSKRKDLKTLLFASCARAMDIG
ncbi:hypothetical protein M5689_024739 [Euphorbia peplus]|nr:hypothetical protein M5689_024739 [Euphorbia peplus]